MFETFGKYKYLFIIIFNVFDENSDKVMNHIQTDL